ncbi:SET domain-containing protein 4-like [Hydractinia symbiolongicarpus]|uniref:SET domain-containing protein 4-like n=1 Tax=Hydractinia symbiolongicarpus TaxID=13093 RepID=UPI00254FC250|nr:SET domain-containing protein 4-like [Hydractinia symbiolongicarpus]
MKDNMGRTARKRRRKGQRSLTCHKNTYETSLFKWALENGLMLRGVTWSSFENTGRGLKATKYFYENDTIISIPRTLLLTFDDVWSTKIKHAMTVLSSKHERLTAKSAFSLFLVLEKYKGHASKYWSYMNSLPSFYTTPSYIPTREAAKMPEFVRDNIKEHKKSILHQFNNIQTVLFMITQKLKITKEDVCWAWNTINTRSIYFHPRNLRCSTHINASEIDFALAPVLDLLNHDSLAKIDATFNVKKESYEIKTFDTYKPNDQIFINYGPHSNRTLFSEYGFFIPNNSHTFIPIALEKVTQYFGAGTGIETYRTSSILKKIGVNTNKLGITKTGFDWSFIMTAHVLQCDINTEVDYLSPCTKHCPVTPACVSLLKDMICDHGVKISEMVSCTSSAASVVRGLIKSEITLMDIIVKNIQDGKCLLE